ncbi:MAG: pyrroline-5-carboxylate reductase [Magnetospirillum sp. WYHS-4]
MLVLVGGGKMGSALLGGWLDRGVASEDVIVVEPVAEQAVALHSRGVAVVAGAEELPADLRPEVVVLAVKPQAMDTVAPVYGRFAATGTVFLSIAAGKTLAVFARLLGPRAAVVRSMPNTPAAVRRGVTVACASPSVDAAQRRRCQDLLEAVGACYWVDDERLMDAVTAVSGSGPAYVFLLAECLAKAGAAAGLPAGLAADLARATVAGSGELLFRSPEAPETLRKNVTSPGGTTAAALGVLMADDGLQPLMDRAIAAATRRSRDLAG